MGTLHGGILCDLADAAIGFAFARTLAPGESFTTLELKINFLRPYGKRAWQRRQTSSNADTPWGWWNVTSTMLEGGS